MSINLSDSAEAYNELKNHIGHNIVCVGYVKAKPDSPPVNVAIECEDCGIVLVDFDRPDSELPDGITLKQAHSRKRKRK